MTLIPRGRAGLALLGAAVALLVAGAGDVSHAGTSDTFDVGDRLPRGIQNFAVTEAGPGAAAGVNGLFDVSPTLERASFHEEEDVEPGDYDPWEPFNEKMFWFNHQVLDRFVLKPVATAWDKAVPDRAKRSLKNAFENLGMPRRFMNNLLQGKVQRAGLELARFIFNSTAGIAGLFDVATAIEIEKVPDEDFGQTLGVYGSGSGPYVVLPFFPPLTVRDGIGLGIDSALDPLNYLLPFGARAGISLGQTVNDRSLNLELFHEVEESVLDLYSAVRNGYLQRRERAIQE
ncbi:MAG: VacJ family lipoprotein [Candidatus Rokubacteria bacterium]|nr:VacJ family lipoprotein [Candidatus Rokubacteria bacterium]